MTEVKKEYVHLKLECDRVEDEDGTWSVYGKKCFYLD